ncbi:MAG: hypothetical protein PHI55_00765 [Burkholderiaceae bacterium]|nr:hypothetical protein [Burkholderiaceae bacterium]
MIGKIIFSQTFEEAATHVKHQNADAFLVPAAYPGLNKFVMDEELETFQTCIHRIPALIYACPKNITNEDLTSKPIKIYHHPAVNPLPQEVEVINKYFES